MRERERERGGGERRGKAQGLGGKEVEGRVGGDVREGRDCV